MLAAMPFSTLLAQRQVSRPRPYTQVQDSRTTVLKVNVPSIFALTGSGFIEHAFSPRISGQLGGYITGASLKGVKFSGYGITPEVRYYLSESSQAPNGFYVAGYGRILSYKLTVDDKVKEKQYKATYAPIGAGVAAGNQWIFGNGLAIDIFIGANYNVGSLKVNTGTEDDFDTGFLNLFGSGVRLRPGLAIGYSF